MEEISSFEARTHFSELLRRVEKGAEFVVTMRGKPIAALTGVGSEHRAKSVDELLGEFGKLRSEIAKRGTLLKAGETWKDLGRDGLKW